MGTFFRNISAYSEYSTTNDLPEQPRQVLQLAEKSIRSLIESGLPGNISHLIVATTCPDSIAPSLGQTINEKFSDFLSDCHTIDIVQGCAGGVTAMILGSELSELNKSTVMVVCADAARKSTSRSSRLNKTFGNGSFACLISYEDSQKGLVHKKSKQFKGLSEVVSVNLGHDADRIIMKETRDMANDPWKHLGLSMNNILAIKLMRQAENFYLSFVEKSEKPDVMILHQVNPLILKHLASVFKKYNLDFINVSHLTGNCGVASVGIALDTIKEKIQGKKVLLCSFGTGGVISAGLWNN
jgi:3-oxoacyl-[acyl-carrier-protein] synthase III